MPHRPNLLSIIVGFLAVLGFLSLAGCPYLPSEAVKGPAGSFKTAENNLSQADRRLGKRIAGIVLAVGLRSEAEQILDGIVNILEPGDRLSISAVLKDLAGIDTRHAGIYERLRGAVMASGVPESIALSRELARMKNIIGFARENL